MEEILQNLGCINLANNGINYQPQLVQDVFHQQQLNEQGAEVQGMSLGRRQFSKL